VAKRSGLRNYPKESEGCLNFEDEYSNLLKILFNQRFPNQPELHQ